MLYSSGENLDFSFIVSNKKQTKDMKHVSMTMPSSPGENTSELNACTLLKKKLKTRHNEFENIYMKTNFGKTWVGS